jgi:hypothetical protein
MVSAVTDVVAFDDEATELQKSSSVFVVWLETNDGFSLEYIVLASDVPTVLP